MNQEEHKKILQNLTYMKGRLVELDPLIDKLIEKDVFKFEHREQIECHPTAHRQFNEFIKILRASPHKDAFACFLDALIADGHQALVQKLQSTVPREIGFAKTPGKVVVPPPRQTTAQPKPTAPHTSSSLLTSRHEPSTSNTPVEHSRYEFAERVSTVPSKDSDYSETGGLKAMLEQFQQKQNIILDKRAREMKKEQQDFILKNEVIMGTYQNQLQQIQKFFGRWENEKQELMKTNRKTSEKLQDQMDAFDVLKNQYEELKRQYDNLKDQYSQLSSRRAKNEDRGVEERGGDLKRSNEDLRNRCSKLSEENYSLQQALESVQMGLKEEKEAYQTLEDQNTEMKSEEERLKNMLREKDRECKRLKDKVEKQQVQIRGLLQKQKEVEYFGPQVMVGEDMYGSGNNKDYGEVKEVNAYGSKKKTHRKK
ncbi:uncharacterized protein LOC110456061 [Mizuhopecten yessoensis]|uniref:CARD domain-containing protein n=1 Tax=Mizuhopecten yessoensis TaxID=6573 RepID=A0A210R429_MIZYE|nr:uncharacterized protein LOC110456061 [Mizuhopecten yessoensis]OWF55716.1 hypothetical protein KP79_PYT11165 [Mizuhopecten yessoensis]